jgi:TnpA family transposase
VGEIARAGHDRISAKSRQDPPHRQPLGTSFGAADVSSSDGQHFPTAGPGEAVGAVNAHYERTASALFYTHLSARQAPYHTVTIPPSGEAAYVIDGLLYHEADL